MQKLTKEFNKASVKKGEYFAIELLDSNPSTGYGWDLQLKAGKASLVAEDYISDAKPGSMVYGGGGKEVFVFKAEEARRYRDRSPVQARLGKQVASKVARF